ncbi:WD40-repeat-containing domain protein [Cladochytrium replicatum]|nr:WD40-repeat-containing domain protein [Cladochytrium replicatum]
MGRKNDRPPLAPSSTSFTSAAASAQQHHVQQTHDASRLSRFSPSVSLFATIGHGLDGGDRVRIFDVATSGLSCEVPVRNGAVGCIQWGWISEEPSPETASEPTPKRKRGSSGLVKTEVVAAGHSTGSISLVSPTHGALIRTLGSNANSHTAAVADFAFIGDGVRALSVGEDGAWVDWDLRKGVATRRTRVDAKGGAAVRRVCVSNRKEPRRVVTAGYVIKLWDYETSECLQTYTGHATPVMGLAFTPDDLSCVSIAEEDRNACVWNTGPDASSSTTNSTVLNIEAFAISLSISPEGHVLVVTDEGTVSYWKDTKTAVATATGKKKARFTARAPEGRLSITAAGAGTATEEAGGEERRIAVVAATFVDGMVVTGRGGLVKPVFEKLPYVDEKGEILQSVSVARAPGNMLIDTSAVGAGNKRGHSSTGSLTGVHIASGEFSLMDIVAAEEGPMSKEGREAMKSFEDDPTLEERLHTMSLLTSTGKSTAGTPKPTNSDTTKERIVKGTPRATTLVNVLVQAVQTGDAAMLEQALNVGEHSIIMATVQRLPVSVVGPLLGQIQERLAKSPRRAGQLVEWIRAIVMVHASFVVGSAGGGTLGRQLGVLHGMMEGRTGVYGKLLRLVGRLDLVIQQIQGRKDGAAAENEEDEKEAVVYNEEEDDSEEDGEEGGDEEQDDDEDLGEEWGTSAAEVGGESGDEESEDCEDGSDDEDS